MSVRATGNSLSGADGDCRAVDKRVRQAEDGGTICMCIQKSTIPQTDGQSARQLTLTPALCLLKSPHKEQESVITNPRLRFWTNRITILFGVSLFFLMVHLVDDAITTGEPAQYGMTLAEFLFYGALLYLIIPPLGLWLARRGSLLGLIIVTLYAFQAMYGAGLNHVRHMFGDFGGSKLLPVLLANVGITITDIRGYGLGSMLMGMAGLGQTPPHTHTLFSSLVAFIDIGLNAALLVLCFFALYAWWQARTARISAAASQPKRELVS